jgi:hypothetical protein
LAVREEGAAEDIVQPTLQQPKIVEGQAFAQILTDFNCLRNAAKLAESSPV